MEVNISFPVKTIEELEAMAKLIDFIKSQIQND
jgi:hypothetical protein